MKLLFGLPEDVGLAILSEWLEIYSWTRLECVTALPKQSYLRLLFQRFKPVALQRPHSMTTYRWLSNRSIPFTKVVLTSYAFTPFGDLTFDFNFSLIQELTINDIGIEDYVLIRFVNLCSNLTTLSARLDYFSIRPGILEKLRSITINSSYSPGGLDGYRAMKEHCHQLRSFTAPLNMAVNWGDIIANNANLEHVDIVTSTFPFAMLMNCRMLHTLIVEVKTVPPLGNVAALISTQSSLKFLQLKHHTASVVFEHSDSRKVNLMNWTQTEMLSFFGAAAPAGLNVVCLTDPESDVLQSVVTSSQSSQALHTLVVSLTVDVLPTDTFDILIQLPSLKVFCVHGVTAINLTGNEVHSNTITAVVLTLKEVSMSFILSLLKGFTVLDHLVASVICHWDYTQLAELKRLILEIANDSSRRKLFGSLELSLVPAMTNPVLRFDGGSFAGSDSGLL